ncbi:MAG TPA: hypothetical protein VFA32_22545, partial [Dehalococcoidia bacterium]|nr:hypothetical protein [Dehalococcoidia bacterium]
MSRRGNRIGSSGREEESPGSVPGPELCDTTWVSCLILRWLAPCASRWSAPPSGGASNNYGTSGIAPEVRHSSEKPRHDHTVHTST